MNIHYTPRSVLSLTESLPGDVVIETSLKGGLFEQEEWGALFSTDPKRKWRYALWRVWEPDKPLYIALMLNPSTADHLTNDPTVEGICSRARKGRYGGVIVINAFAYRATEPADMKKADNPIGEHNDLVISHVIAEKDSFLLCAWGIHITHQDRGEQVQCLIRSNNARPHYLRLTGSGEPGHPLYIPRNIAPSAWDMN